MVGAEAHTLPRSQVSAQFAQFAPLHPHSGIACVWLEAALLPLQSHRYSAPKIEREAWQVLCLVCQTQPNTAWPRPHRQLPATLRDGITREGPRHSLGTFLVSSSAALSSHADVSRQGWFQALPHHEHTALSAAKQPQPSGVGGRATSCPFPQLPPGPRCPPQPAASPLQRRMPGGTRHHKLCSQHQPAYPGEMTSRKFVTPASHLFNGGNVYTEDCGLID